MRDRGSPPALFVTMRRTALALFGGILAACTPPAREVCGASFCLSIGAPQTLAGIGAGQGLEVRDGLVWAFGDSTTGVIRAFTLDSAGTFAPADRVIRLTLGGADEISHPTGLTFREPYGTYVGNTVKERGELFRIDWARATSTGTLDGAILHRVGDDAAGNGSRPEFVRSGDAWLLASADYGNDDPELRLYDPLVLESAAGTAESKVVVARFPTTGYVQALHYWESRDILVLVQNRRAGRGWRLTLVALAASIEAGTLQVLDVLEPAFPGELEGFHFVDESRAVMLTSARERNAFTVTLRDKLAR